MSRFHILSSTDISTLTAQGEKAWKANVKQRGHHYNYKWNCFLVGKLLLKAAWGRFQILQSGTIQAAEQKQILASILLAGDRMKSEF